MTEITLVPADFLKRLISQAEPAPGLYLLTGASGTGKTTWCLDLLRQARAAGLQPVGLVSPAVFKGGVKTGIDLMDAATGERHRLAVRYADANPVSKPSDPPLHWDFDLHVIAWGNEALAHLPASALLLLDELGPLEFHHGGGFTAGLARLDAVLDRAAVVVIRPALLEAARERWPWAQVCVPAGVPMETSQP